MTRTTSYTNTAQQGLTCAQACQRLARSLGVLHPECGRPTLQLVRMPPAQLPQPPQGLQTLPPTPLQSVLHPPRQHDGGAQ